MDATLTHLVNVVSVELNSVVNQLINDRSLNFFVGGVHVIPEACIQRG